MSNEYLLKLYANDVAKTSQYGAGVAASIVNSKFRKDSNPYQQQKLVQEKDQPLYKSALGTPVYSNFEIQGGSWTDEDGNVNAWNNLRFDTVVIIVDDPKLIIKTPIQGSKRRGTVKEYISDGDYMVDIQLLLVGNNGVRPFDQLAELKKAINAPMALAVNSRFLQALNICNLVFERCTYPEIEGAYSTIPVSISASSDEPIELILR